MPSRRKRWRPGTLTCGMFVRANPQGRTIAYFRRARGPTTIKIRSLTVAAPGWNRGLTSPPPERSAVRELLAPVEPIHGLLHRTTRERLHRRPGGRTEGGLGHFGSLHGTATGATDRPVLPWPVRRGFAGRTPHNSTSACHWQAGEIIRPIVRSCTKVLKTNYWFNWIDQKLPFLQAALSAP